jgi:sterol desaturase/sphingolipid hydroxylase (fatty acid hydroxylase superfamily)
LHKTHHTAEVLTPLTLFRVHPLDTLIFSNIVALCVGIAMGVINHVAGGRVAAFEIDGANVILFVLIYALVQLQHSQFWLAFPAKLGFLLLSPAHHQIHHSIDPAHYNANFGGTLAIFDWAFGTLLLPPRENPHLRFGVVDGAANPHGLTTLLLAPIGESAGAIARTLAYLRPKRRAAPLFGVQVRR